MKKVTALVLVLVLVLSMATNALAATVTPTFSSTSVEAGSDVTVELKLDEDIDDVVCADYRLFFNADHFTLKDSAVGNSHSDMQISNLKTDANGKPHYMVSYVDPTSEGQTLAAGTMYTLTFTANADLTAEEVSGFELVNKGVYSLVDGTFIELEAPVSNGSVSVTITPKIENPGYTVSLSDDTSVSVGETATVAVTVGHTSSEVTVLNSYDMTITYDPAVLKLTSTEINGLTINDENGTVRVMRYGDDLAVNSKIFELTFEAIGVGESNIEVTKALVGRTETANLQEADTAVLLDSADVTVTGYTVSLPEDVTGEAVTKPGDDYTFEVKDKNYDYTFTATVNGNPVDVMDNGDGTYTIAAADITGNIVITVASKVGKTVNVTLGTDMTGNETAQYMTDYEATLTKQDGYTYQLAVTINNETYTGYSYDEATGKVTIPGSSITGDIVFTVTKTAIPVTSYGVTFAGSGAGDAEGETTAKANEAYNFKVNKAEGYTYTVTAKMGDQTVDVTGNSDGTYTIAKVTDDVVITIDKTGDMEVKVDTYVELDGKTVFLVTATGTLADNQAYAYDGTVMYKSAVYDNAWCWLVIVNEGETFTAEDAAAKITAVEATYTNLTQTYDVNMAGRVDINDAQLIYDIYNCEYSDFSVVSMQKFLNADTNGDKAVNVNDAAAVVNNIQ